MIAGREPTPDQTKALVHHRQEFIDVTVRANNELVARLLASPDFSEQNRSVLQRWSDQNNLIHLQFDRQVAKLGAGGLSPDDIANLAQLMTGVINDVTFANDELRKILLASADLSEADRATLDMWTVILGDIVAFSEAHVMELRSGPAPRVVH